VASAATREKVLIVDEDADVLDLVSRQVLEPLGFDVITADDAGSAIQQTLSARPDVIVASLSLPGLSGKDLLVALRGQGMETPVIVAAAEGMEADAVQAFRLGARDYLVKPLREAEIVAAVERVLNEVRLRRERQRLAGELAESNRQLERRVRELTTLYGIGKMVTSTTNQVQLFAKLMEGSLYVAEADMGWVLLRDESTDQKVLRAQSHLPPAIAGKLHQAWDDGVSSLVMLSGEALRIHGDGLAQFKLARFGKAALIAPITVRDKPIGTIAVIRDSERPFTDREQAMLEAVADYASISLVNSRLFQALEARAHRLQQVVDEVNAGALVDADWLTRMKRGLRAARGELAQLRDTTSDADVGAAVQAVDSDLDALLRQISEVEARPGKEASGETAVKRGA
jgi:two-component system NtrC family sensor kinase